MEPNMDEDTKQTPQISHFIRKFDNSGHPLGNRIIVHKDWLWSAGGLPAVIKQWNCEGKCIRTLEDTTGGIESLLGWRDCLYSGSDDNSILVWSIITGECVRKLIGHDNTVYAL